MGHDEVGAPRRGLVDDRRDRVDREQDARDTVCDGSPVTSPTASHDSAVAGG